MFRLIRTWLTQPKRVGVSPFVDACEAQYRTPPKEEMRRWARIVGIDETETPKLVHELGTLNFGVHIWRFSGGWHVATVYSLSRALSYGDLRALADTLDEARQWLEAHAPNCLYADEPTDERDIIGRRLYRPELTLPDVVGHA